MAENTTAPAPAPTNPAPTTTPTPPAAPAAPAAAAASSDWTSGLNDDMRGWIQNKGFKGPSDLADSYRNLEKLHGVGPDRLLKMPESMDSPEGRAILERLGAPKEAKDYQLETPQGGDPKVSEWAAGEFHKLGVPKAMAENFVKAWNAKNSLEAQTLAETQRAAGLTAEANLKTEWGNAYDQNRARVESAARVLGLGENELKALNQSLGGQEAPKLLLKLAAATQESGFIGGTPAAAAAQTPEQARSAISELGRDRDFMNRLARGDHEARAKWTRVHEAAFPGNLPV